MYCKSCGKELDSGAKSCANCGAATAEQPAASAQNAPAASAIPPQYAPLPLPGVLPMAAKREPAPDARIYTALALLCAILAAAFFVGLGVQRVVENIYYLRAYLESENSQYWDFYFYLQFFVNVPAFAFGIAGLVLSIIANRKGGKAKPALIISIIVVALAAIGALACLIMVFQKGIEYRLGL